MKKQILVVGLGRLGVAITAALLRQGHHVIAIEIDCAVREQISQGLSPFKEPGVADLIEAGQGSGCLRVMHRIDPEDRPDMIFVCVGTPGRADGSLDLSDVKAAAHAVGEAVSRRTAGPSPVLIAFRSTLAPGSMRGVVLPALRQTAGEPPGDRYRVVYHPEFLREGSAVADFFSPSRIVIGEQHADEARPILELYSGIDAPTFLTSFETAEFIKFADNSFHALKVSFANEMGRLALRLGLSPRQVSQIFLADSKLNLSSSYLQPGGPFGGPCLPKDVRAFATMMSDNGVDAPVTGGIIESNASHLSFLVAEIESRVSKPARILLVGLSFKSGTDDLRDSPLIKLAERLLAGGHHLTVYDPDLGRDDGATARTKAQLSPSLYAVLQWTLPSTATWDLIVLGKRCPEIESQARSTGIFDINRL